MKIADVAVAWIAFGLTIGLLLVAIKQHDEIRALQREITTIQRGTDK